MKLNRNRRYVPWRTDTSQRVAVECLMLCELKEFLPRRQLCLVARSLVSVSIIRAEEIDGNKGKFQNVSITTRINV